MKLYPRIHVTDPVQASMQVAEAADLGVTGVFLQSRPREKDGRELLLAAFNDARERLPEVRLGMVMLGMRPISAFGMIHDMLGAGQLVAPPDLLWAEDGLAEGQPGEALDFRAQHKELQRIRYFGGIAGKRYMGEDWKDAKHAASLAVRHKDRVDVVTTTGERNRASQVPEKLIEMHSALMDNGRELLVTSGVTPRTIDDYAGYIDGLIPLIHLDARPAPGVIHRPQLRILSDRVHELRAA